MKIRGTSYFKILVENEVQPLNVTNLSDTTIGNTVHEITVNLTLSNWLLVKSVFAQKYHIGNSLYFEGRTCMLHPCMQTNIKKHGEFRQLASKFQTKGPFNIRTCMHHGNMEHLNKIFEKTE